MNAFDGTQADLVLCRGKVVTVDDQNSVKQAVAVKDGRIVKTGTSDEILELAGPETEVIDLDGKTVLPGFIDAHVHIDCTAAHTKLATSAHIPAVDYVETQGAVGSRSDILGALRKKAEETPKGKWIILQGRFSLATDGNSPTKEQLDAVTRDHPVILRYSAHFQLLNSKALQMSGIDAQNPTYEALEEFAPGAKILRDSRTGEPTGEVIECIDWIFPRQSPFSAEDLREAIQSTCIEAVSFGVTSIHEFISWSESSRIYQEMHQEGKLPLRVQLCPSIWGMYRSVDLSCITQLGIKTGFGNEWIKFGRVKLFVDVEGSDDEGQFKEWPRISQEKLNELVYQAHKAGIGVMMHATSREAQMMAIDAVEAASQVLPPGDYRARIEHFGGDYWPEGIERMKRLRMIPVPTPYSSLAWYGDTWLDSSKPGEKAVIYRTLLNEGLMPPGNSDSMGTEPEALNPWWSIWCVVARKSRSGRLICPEEGITLEEAIRIYTRYAAYAGFEENVKGSIETGKVADFAILAQDPFSLDIDDLQHVEVDTTIVDGRIVYKRD